MARGIQQDQGRSQGPRRRLSKPVPPYQFTPDLLPAYHRHRESTVRSQHLRVPAGRSSITWCNDEINRAGQSAVGCSKTMAERQVFSRPFLTCPQVPGEWRHRNRSGREGTCRYREAGSCASSRTSRSAARRPRWRPASLQARGEDALDGEASQSQVTFILRRAPNLGLYIADTVENT